MVAAVEHSQGHEGLGGLVVVLLVEDGEMPLRLQMFQQFGLVFNNRIVHRQKILLKALSTLKGILTLSFFRKSAL